MSAPTVAITANPAISNGPSLALDSNSNPNTRRRTVAIAEKKSNIEMVSEGGISGGKDLINSIRGETVVRKSKELLQARKELIDATVSPRRRKALPKAEKPRWKRVLSILTKNTLLLIVLFGLVQMIPKLKSVWELEDRMGAPVGDLEGKISELEKTVKGATKFMQFQVDVLDKKIVDGIGSLREELTEKIEERDIFVKNELEKLEGRAGNLDKSLAELRDKSFLSKEEFDNFLNELKSKGLGESDEDLTLDKIRDVAREIVEKEIAKHAADGLGRVDYALASSGGKVIRHSEPFYFDKGSSWLPVVKSRNGVHYLAQKMLEPSFGEPGQCFPLKGRNGFIEVRLRTAIIPESVTLEHVAKSVAYDRSSAPKDCRISGWFQGHDDDPLVQSDRMLKLVEFAYDLEKSNAQTFNIEAANVGTVNVIRLDFVSNYGSPSHTCIYRLRVHGYQPESVLSLAVQA